MVGRDRRARRKGNFPSNSHSILDQSAQNKSAMARTPSPTRPAIAPYHHSYLSFVSMDAKMAVQL